MNYRTAIEPERLEYLRKEGVSVHDEPNPTITNMRDCSIEVRNDEDFNNILFATIRYAFDAARKNLKK